MRYIEFLEEQRVRDERNYKLLGILDRVDESLAFMTVKTDRLCILKVCTKNFNFIVANITHGISFSFIQKEYEASLMRICMNRHQVSSMTGDSGVHSQNENQQLKQDIRNLSNFTPRSRYNVERRFHNSPVSPGILKNFNTLVNPKLSLDIIFFVSNISKQLRIITMNHFF